MDVVATPVLLLTQDDYLWQHWRTLDSRQWLPARGSELSELRRWREQRRSVAIIDTGLPGLPAWNTPAWQALFDGMRVIVASVRPNDEEGMQVFLAGALGYCHAYAPAVTLTQVLAAVATGSVWMGASLVARLLRQVDTLASASGSNSPGRWHHDALSEREHVIALRVSQGESNGKIAFALGISERTVKAHLTSIFDKLDIADRLQLALLVHGITSQAHA